jgi:hypothetical protein
LSIAFTLKSRGVSGWKGPPPGCRLEDEGGRGRTREDEGGRGRVREEGEGKGGSADWRIFKEED